ncbi:MAG: amidohydrolase family protein [Smithella sp.]
MKNFILILILYFLFYPVLSTAATEKEPKRIIDIHCHIAGIGAGGSGCFVSPSLRRNWRYRIYLKAFGITEKDLEREGDAIAVKRISETVAASRLVEKAVILAMDGIIDEKGNLDMKKTEIYIPDNYVACQVRRYPNLLFGASINPHRKDAIQRLEQAKADGAVLIKWLPSVQLIDPADRRLIPFYLKMKELDLPLLCHTGSENSFTWKKDELADPERLRLPLSLGVTVIAAHSGGFGKNGGEANFKRFLRLAQEYPNLYADISALTQVNRLRSLNRLLKHRELQGRLLYGSDMPLINTVISSPFFHTCHLRPWTFFKIMANKNPWDRNVALNKALGVTDEMLGNSGKILKMKHTRLIHPQKNCCRCQ